MGVPGYCEGCRGCEFKIGDNGDPLSNYGFRCSKVKVRKADDLVQYSPTITQDKRTGQFSCDSYKERVTILTQLSNLVTKLPDLPNLRRIISREARMSIYAFRLSWPIF